MSGENNGYDRERREKEFYEGYLEYTAARVMDDVNNRYNQLIKDTEAFGNEYNDRYKNGNPEWRGDSSDYFDKVTKAGEHYLSEAEYINTMLDKYKGYYDEDVYSGVGSFLGNSRLLYSQARNVARQDNKYWSQFKNEGDYNFRTAIANGADEAALKELFDGMKSGYASLDDFYNDIEYAEDYDLFFAYDPEEYKKAVERINEINEMFDKEIGIETVIKEAGSELQRSLRGSASDRDLLREELADLEAYRDKFLKIAEPEAYAAQLAEAEKLANMPAWEKALLTVGDFVTPAVYGATKGVEDLVELGPRAYIAMKDASNFLASETAKSLLYGIPGVKEQNEKQIKEWEETKQKWTGNLDYDWTGHQMGKYNPDGTIVENKGSYLYDISPELQSGIQQVGEGVGGMGPAIVASAINPALGQAVFFGSSAGGGAAEASVEGADATTALLYGLASGGAEMLTEKIGGNMFGQPTDLASSWVGKQLLKTGAGKYVNQGLGKAAYTFVSEGVEESIMDLISPGLKVGFNIGDASERYSRWEDGWEDVIKGIPKTFVVGGTVGSVIEGIYAGAFAIKNISAGRKSIGGFKGGVALNTVSKEMIHIADTLKAVEAVNQSAAGAQTQKNEYAIAANGTILDSISKISDKVQALSEEQRINMFEEVPVLRSYLNEDGSVRIELEKLMGLSSSIIADNTPASTIKSFAGKSSEDITSRIEKRLSTQILDTASRHKLATTISNVIQGQEFSRAAIRSVIGNKYALKVLNDYLGTKLTSNANARDVRLAVAEKSGDNSYKGQAEKFSAILDLGKNGTRGLASFVQNAKGVNVGNLAQAFNDVYRLGKKGADIDLAKNPYLSMLSEEQMVLAYNYGIMDGAIEKSEEKSSDEVLQKDVERDTIKEKEQEGVKDEQEDSVRLRDGGERNDGENTGRQVSRVEGGTRQDQSGRKTQRRPADAAAASGLNLGEEVSAKSLDIKGGIDSAKVKLVKDGSEFPSMKQAREMAEARGLEVTFFAGGNLKVHINGKIASVRGYIEGNRVFIRVDHSKYTADQLMRHEICHDMIDNGEIDINEVRERIKDLGVDVDYFIDNYIIAYGGSKADADMIWTEIICDSYGDMNEFASLSELGEMNADFLSSLKGEVEASRKDARGPPKSSEGRASRDPQKGRSLEIETMENNRFERLREYRDNLPSEWFAYTRDYYYIYANKSFMDYTILLKVKITNGNKTAIDNFTKEIENGIDGSTKALDSWFAYFRRGKGRNNWNSISSASSGTVKRTDGMDGRNIRRGSGKSTWEHDSGDTQKGSRNSEHYKIDKESNLPIVETFNDVSSRTRKVLKFPNGQYVVKDTQKHNRMFSSIDQAISAENENIIQRYARKNNSTVTWVKNKLAEDSDFLARERRKGKASQDLDFFDYLNENAEDAEITESETIEEHELSNREILANALESMVKTEADKKTLRQYKRRAKALDAMEEELKDTNSKIRELSFSSGARDVNALEEFKKNKKNLENEIQKKDKALIMLEASAPLKKVLERAKKQAADKVKAKAREDLAEQKVRAKEALDKQAKRYQESRKNAIEGRHKTKLKNDIKNVVAELDTLLRKGNKKSNVKIGLQDAVAAALEAFDVNAEKAERYAKDIARLDAKIAAATDPDEVEALTALRDKKVRNSEMLRDKLLAMKKAYEDIHKNAGEENYPAHYRAEAKVILDRISDVIEKVGDVPIGEMSLEQLQSVYDMYRMVLTTVRDVNKAFIDGKEVDLTVDASKVTVELNSIKKLPEERLKAGDGARGFVWNELTPYYAFKRIGSETLMRYYEELVRGQDVYARDLAEAKAFADEIRDKYNASKWKRNNVTVFKDKDGREFRLNLGHMMSIYAYSKRDQALDHMEKGGFFFNNKETFRTKGGILEFISSNESGYKVDATVFAQIKSALTADQIAYVDEMQAYLTKMGEKGNEVTRQMWGIDIFKEAVYFPLKSKEDFIYQANTPAETSSLKNDGMTKETRPGASNPIVLESFDDVWANHVEKMSKYHGFVIPIDNLNKIVNYGTWMSGETQSNTVDLSADTELSTLVEGVYGSAKYKKIAQYILNVLGKEEFSLTDGRLAIVDNSDALHIANKAASKKTAQIAKIRELVKVAELYAQDDNVDHNKFNRFYYYKATVVYDGETFPIYLNVGRAINDGKYHIYDITNKIRDTADRINGLERPKPNEGYALTNGISNKSIPQESENVNRNFSTNSEMGSRSISTMLEARYSSAVNDYLTTFIKDLNGAKAQNGGMLGSLMKGLTKFKKTSVGASLSVIVQQPTAIIRALSEIDARYFVHLPKAEGLRRKWTKVHQYAPVAILKDIGGFDAGSGKQITEWFNADTRQGARRVMNKIDDVTMAGAALGDKIGWASIWAAVEREVLAKQNFKYGTEEFYQACGKRFTEVIVRTQVYDSTLSRSGFMRGKDGLMKMATAFMGEPTLSINMLADAFLQAKRGKIKKRKMIRTVAAVYTATVAASLIKSFIYALRDDDDDESLAEKYLQALGGTILNDINPLAMIPVYRDVVSVFDGWGTDRSDMAIVQDLYDAINALDSQNKSDWRKFEDLAGAMGALAGVPAKNFLRTMREMYNLINDVFDGIEGGDLSGAFIEGITGKEKSKSQTLYEALIGGEEERIKVLRESYKTEKAYETAVRKAIRDHDPRIRAAAIALKNGNIDEWDDIRREIVDEGIFDEQDITKAIELEANYYADKIKEAAQAKEDGDDKEYESILDNLFEKYETFIDEDKIADDINSGVADIHESADEPNETYYRYDISHVNGWFNSGNNERAIEVLEELKKIKSESSLQSGMTSYWKPLYIEAYSNGDDDEMRRIKEILKSTGFYENVNQTTDKWIK